MDEQIVFLSYSHEDASVVEEDLKWLQTKQLKMSYDRDIVPGSDWRDHIAHELMKSSVVIFFSSRHSNRSKHCLAEIGFALDLGKLIIVIRLDDQDLAPGLRLYLGNIQAIHRHRLAPNEYQDNVLQAVHEKIEKEGTDTLAGDEYLFSVSIHPRSDQLSAMVDSIKEFMNFFAYFSPVFDLLSDDNPASEGDLDLLLDIDIDVDCVRITVQSPSGRHSDSKIVYDSCEKPTEVIRQLYDVICTSVVDLLGVNIEQDMSAKVFDADADDLESYAKYLRAIRLELQGYFLEALEELNSVLSITPNFAMALYVKGVIFGNMSEFKKCRKYMGRSIAHCDRLTDRQQHETRATYLTILGDYHMAIQELDRYTSLYPDQASVLGNLALCYLYARKPLEALEALKKVVHIRNDYLSNANLAMYLMYAGKFEDCQNKLVEIGIGREMMTLESTMAICQVMVGKIQDAEIIYESLYLGNETQQLIGALGISDLAAYKGDYTKARDLAYQSITSRSTPLASRLTAYASLFASLAGGEDRNDDNLNQLIREVGVEDHSTQSIYFIGRAAVNAGKIEHATQICDHISERLDGHSELYEKLLRAEIMLLEEEKPKTIITLLRDITGQTDAWMGRFLLATAYQQAGKVVDAHLEWQSCVHRPGEAVAVMLDELPSLHLYGIAMRNHDETKRLLDTG